MRAPDGETRDPGWAAEGTGDRRAVDRQGFGRREVVRAVRQQPAADPGPFGQAGAGTRQREDTQPADTFERPTEAR